MQLCQRRLRCSGLQTRWAHRLESLCFAWPAVARIGESSSLAPCSMLPSRRSRPFPRAPTLWLRSGKFPFLPPLHSGEHRNWIGNFNITNQPKVFAENFRRSCFAQWIRRRIGLRSIKKDTRKLPSRSQQLRGTLGILWPSPWVKRAQKRPFIDQIKTILEIELEKISMDNFAIEIPQRFFDLGDGNRWKIDCGDVETGALKKLQDFMIGPAARDQDPSSRSRSLDKGPECRGNSMKRPRCFPARIALIPKSWHSAIARFAHLYCCLCPKNPVARLQITKGSATAIFAGVISHRARNWRDEKLHQNSFFDFGGSDLQCWFWGRASELQENRQELPHER